MRVVLALLLLLAVFLSGVWDLIVVAKGHPEDTVSVTLHQWSLLYPILPLAVGIIVGHIFWPNVGLITVPINRLP